MTIKASDSAPRRLLSHEISAAISSSVTPGRIDFQYLVKQHVRDRGGLLDAGDLLSVLDYRKARYHPGRRPEPDPGEEPPERTVLRICKRIGFKPRDTASAEHFCRRRVFEETPGFRSAAKLLYLTGALQGIAGVADEKCVSRCEDPRGRSNR